MFKKYFLPVFLGCFLGLLTEGVLFLSTGKHYPLILLGAFAFWLWIGFIIGGVISFAPLAYLSALVSSMQQRLHAQVAEATGFVQKKKEAFLLAMNARYAALQDFFARFAMKSQEGWQRIVSRFSSKHASALKRFIRKKKLIDFSIFLGFFLPLAGYFTWFVLKPRGLMDTLSANAGEDLSGDIFLVIVGLAIIFLCFFLPFISVTTKSKGHDRYYNRLLLDIRKDGFASYTRGRVLDFLKLVAFMLLFVSFLLVLFSFSVFFGFLILLLAIIPFSCFLPFAKKYADAPKKKIVLLSTIITFIIGIPAFLIFNHFYQDIYTVFLLSLTAGTIGGSLNVGLALLANWFHSRYGVIIIDRYTREKDKLASGIWEVMFKHLVSRPLEKPWTLLLETDYRQMLAYTC